MSNKNIDYYYKKIPRLNCQKKCYDVCGVIMISPVESEIIKKRIGYDLMEKFVENVEKGCFGCPLLKDNLCSIYDIRPAICRLYGVAEGLKCKYGCKPIKYLKDHKVRKLLNKIDAIKDDVCQ